MAVILLCFVVVGAGVLIGYGIFKYLEHREMQKTPGELMEMAELKASIVETVFKEAYKKSKDQQEGAHILKIKVIETLDILPLKLKSCVKQLIKEQIIMETEDALALTTFGVQYYKSFVKPTRVKKKKA